MNDDGVTMSVRFTDEEEAWWKMNECDEHAKEDAIKVESKGYKFVQKFKCRGDTCEASNREVIEILPRSKNYKFRLNDNKEYV